MLHNKISISDSVLSHICFKHVIWIYRSIFRKLETLYVQFRYCATLY